MVDADETPVARAAGSAAARMASRIWGRPGYGRPGEASFVRSNRSRPLLIRKGVACWDIVVVDSNLGTDVTVNGEVHGLTHEVRDAALYRNRALSVCSQRGRLRGRMWQRHEPAKARVVPKPHAVVSAARASQIALLHRYMAKGRLWRITTGCSRRR